MINQNIKGMTALITGASSGIGKDFAKILASHGANLVIVARREDELQKLKQEIITKYSVTCEVATSDLTVPGAVSKILKDFPRIDILINNAGFGLFGEAANYDVSKTLNMLDLNMRVLTELTLGYLPFMLKQNKGYILQIASIAAYQACPMYAAYGATKSYVLNFSEALHQELKNTHIYVSTLCPGITATSFFDVAGQQMNAVQKAMLMKSEDVARQGLIQLFNRTASYIPGAHNRLTIFFNRLFPRSAQRKIVDYMMRH